MDPEFTLEVFLSAKAPGMEHAEVRKVGDLPVEKLGKFVELLKEL